MSPYEVIAARYAAHPQERDFDWYVRHHLAHGFVFSTPDFFVMGRPVRRLANPEHVTEPTFLFQHDTCDCWFIHAMAGDMRKAWEMLPWPLGWIAFERILDGERELRIYELERVRAMCPISPETLHAIAS